MFDAAFAGDVISDLSTGSYKVIRRNAASIKMARPVRGTVAATFDIDATVQPASGRDLERLPQGRQTTETKLLETTTELQVGGQGHPLEADRVVIDGAEWEVQNVQPWPGHYKCLLQLVAPGQAP
jgi:hypothetical protein